MSTFVFVHNMFADRRTIPLNLPGLTDQKLEWSGKPEQRQHKEVAGSQNPATSFPEH